MLFNLLIITQNTDKSIETFDQRVALSDCLQKEQHKGFYL